MRPAGEGALRTRVYVDGYNLYYGCLKNTADKWLDLPPMVRLKSGAVHKPLSWYPCPELLIPVYEEAKRVRGSNGAARRWLNEPCKQLGNRVPIEMCSSQESARELLEYMRRYAIECCV